jgi:hypothetical protein
MINKLLVKQILQHAHQFNWTLQGLGMLRMYLSDEVRLHVWDRRFAVPNASPIHDHPWSLDSLIVAGKLANVRYVPAQESGMFSEFIGQPYQRVKIKCGVGTCTMSPVDTVYLRRLYPETYVEGDIYHQDREEIHQSLPFDGTVTIVTRRFDGDRDHAQVMWKNGDFVSAEPRPAAFEEVHAIVSNSLSKWF